MVKCYVNVAVERFRICRGNNGVVLATDKGRIILAEFSKANFVRGIPDDFSIF